MASRDELGIAKPTLSGDFATNKSARQGQEFSLFEEFLANSSNHAAHIPSEHEAIKVIWEPWFPPGCYFCLESRFALIILTLLFHSSVSEPLYSPWPRFLNLGSRWPMARFLCSLPGVSMLCPHCQQEVQFLCLHPPLKTSHWFFSCSWDIRQERDLVKKKINILRFGRKTISSLNSLQTFSF